MIFVNKAFAELIEIYHAQKTEPTVRPPLPRSDQTKKKDAVP